MVRAARLTTDLEMRDASFSREIRRANRQLDGFTKKINRVSRNVNQLGRSFRTLVGAEILRRGIASQLEYADSLAKTARQLGGSVEFLSEAAAAAKLAGVETNQLTTGLQRMTRRLSEAADGGGATADAFRELGLDARKLEQLTLDQQFTTILQALSGVEGEADRVRLAFKFFDSEGVKIARLAGNFDELRRTARNAGATITDQFATQAETINDQLSLATERLNNHLRTSVAFAFQLAQGFAAAAFRASGLPDGALGQLQQSARETTQEIIQLEAALQVIDQSRHLQGSAERAAALEARLASARVTLRGYVRDIQEINDANERTDQPRSVNIPGLGNADDVKLEIKTIKSQLEDLVVTPESAEAYRRAAGEAGVYIEELNTRIVEDSNRTTSQLEYGFASWLENTESGVESLGQTFSRILRRMVAQAIASKLFSFIPGGSILGIPFGGGRALGGPVDAGTSYMVGERGPELFIPTQAGRIEPNGSGGGGVTVVNNVDARGADNSLVSALPAILDQNRERTKAEIITLMRQQRISA